MMQQAMDQLNSMMSNMPGGQHMGMAMG